MTQKTKFGDTYNCINYYDQPAFDHPSLKNQKFEYQMRPSRNHSIDSIWVNGYGCPSGTVPFRPVTKDDLIRAKLASQMNSLKFSPQSDVHPGLHSALLRTKVNPSKKYKGAHMLTSIYNPSVENNQVSSSRLKLQNGPDTMEVGWTVNPTLYKDNKTRLYIYTSVRSCYNTLCSAPGFILETSEIPLDYIFPQISQRGGATFSTGFFVYKDSKNGDWYLQVGTQGIEIGRWPQKIFSALADSASHVEWGGQVITPTDVPSPEMGSGDGPPLLLNDKQDAACYQINVVDENYKQVNPDDTEAFTDIGGIYDAVDLGLRGQFGRLMYHDDDGEPLMDYYDVSGQSPEPRQDNLLDDDALEDENVDWDRERSSTPLYEPDKVGKLRKSLVKKGDNGGGGDSGQVPRAGTSGR
ncbi:hypothetical protein Tsubulata_012375, partial [Turnera subulata]